MFWGLIMEPNKRYTQTVDKSFHVSMASLDTTRAGTVPIQVLISVEGATYLLCTLDKNKTWQMPLDLNFMEGTDISFSCNGQGNVHLTGYLTPEDDMDVLEEEEDDDDEDDEEEDNIKPVSPVAKSNKRKPLDLLKGEKDGKRIKPQSVQLQVEEEDDSDFPSQDDDSDDMEDEEDIAMDDDNEDEEEEESENEVKDVKSKNQKSKSKGQIKEKVPEPTKSKPKTAMVKPQQNTQNELKKKKVEGGVQIEDLKVGQGDVAKPGKFVSVYYVGRLKNGKKFDATTQGNGFKFRLGRGEVIKGWEVGIAGMKVGGKRRLVIPPAMAYGAKGSPPIIPGNSQLTFEVELRNVD